LEKERFELSARAQALLGPSPSPARLGVGRVQFHKTRAIPQPVVAAIVCAPAVFQPRSTSATRSSEGASSRVEFNTLSEAENDAAIEACVASSNVTTPGPSPPRNSHSKKPMKARHHSSTRLRSPHTHHIGVRRRPVHQHARLHLVDPCRQRSDRQLASSE
jgi:hypothetical protein